MAVSERARSPDADLGSLEFWGRPAEERDRCFARMRREEPLSRHQPPEDILGLPEQERMSYWAVVRYDDVRRISRDPATFCSAQGVQFGDVPQELLEASQSFLAMDAPRHTKLRGLVSAAFTPRQVARIEEGIARNARQIVEAAAPTGGGDFVELIAKRLPLVTISDMIGVPDADREQVVADADLLVSVADPEAFGERPPLEVLGEAMWKLTEFATDLAAQRERHRAEAAFEDPWLFDITRAPNRQAGFGGGGPHYCLGASLARTQLRSIFAEIARVMPDIEAGEPELLRSSFIHGVKRMRCAFAPRA